MLIRIFFILFLLGFTKSYAQHNTVVIIADDLGTDYLGFYEDYGDTVAVPNLRQLLRRGVRMKHAYANPVCSSTRSTMLTGKYAFRTGVGYIVGNSAGSGELDTTNVTIPKLLRQFNPQIATANIGKWHLNSPNPASNLLTPITIGYQHFEGPFIGQLTSYTNWTKYTNGVSSTITTYATTENVNNAIDWIQSVNTSSPFFLWLAFNAPHEPLHLPPAGLHNFTGLSGLQNDINANPKPYFKAMIQALDHEIGRLMDSLQAINRLDSTDFIFIGDNGNTMKTAQISNNSRAKGTIYDYGIHVPMIISGPSVVNPNRASDDLVNAVDIFATVLELMGNTAWSPQIPLPQVIDSRSLLPTIKNISGNSRPWCFSEIFRNSSDSADGKTMRNQNYKLLKFDHGTQEFYNLIDDPQELNNLLTGLLDSAAASNYNFLCSEMNALLNNGSFCTSFLGFEELATLKTQAYPNPFENTIFVNGISSNENTILYNQMGQVLYDGKQIGNQDFTSLPKGIYFLRTATSNQCFKLIK